MKKNKQPILSICIPTYNRAKLLEENLNKIVAQLDDMRISDFVEIIISDNNSSDNTQNLIESFGKKYNVKYFKNHHNIGGNANVIKVTEYANGEYLWMLSDDDCITDFSIEYVLEIIKKENFDVMFCNSISSEDMNTKIEPKENKYIVCDGIIGFLSHIKDNYKGYKNLISFFSFYSILIVKAEYFRGGLSNLKQEITGNDFPQDMIIYRNLINKRIVIPDNVFVIGRLLNESYVGSTKLIKSFNSCMEFIEERNELKNNSDWEYIKKVCKNGWTKNIVFGLIVGKIHLNYKNNKFLKKIYYFYKKWIQ